MQITDDSMKVKKSSHITEIIFQPSEINWFSSEVVKKQFAEQEHSILKDYIT